MGKIYLEVEEQLKKDIETMRNQNKRLKIDLEQTKVQNAKLKEDMEKIRLEHAKEMTKSKTNMDKLK
jgi:hypothetical protein